MFAGAEFYDIWHRPCGFPLSFVNKHHQMCMYTVLYMYFLIIEFYEFYMYF